MDEIVGFIVLIFYLVAVSAAGKKNKKKKQKKTAEKLAQFAQAFERTEHAFAAKPEPASAAQQQAHTMNSEALQSAAEGSDPCHRDMLRPQRDSMQMADVDPVMLAAAAEGEDPCHIGYAGPAGGLPMDEEAEDTSYMRDEQASERIAQDVLRGVIMSEVLRRPVYGRGMKRRM